MYTLNNTTVIKKTAANCSQTSTVHGLHKHKASTSQKPTGQHRLLVSSQAKHNCASKSKAKRKGNTLAAMFLSPLGTTPDRVLLTCASHRTFSWQLPCAKTLDKQCWSRKKEIKEKTYTSVRNWREWVSPAWKRHVSLEKWLKFIKWQPQG